MSGGGKVKLGNNYLQAYAEGIAMDEEAQVKFLRPAPGGAAVARPAIDLGKRFQTLATAAKLEKAEKLNPFGNQKELLLGAFVFEDAGVSAYHGAATLLRTRPVSQRRPASSRSRPNMRPRCSHTTSQVPSIVYPGGTGSGGFFPAGLNGGVRRGQDR